jgi:NAD(P)-dependent dehydrogenase (short-subunit alcohol dehydrogenase family)
MLQEATTKTAAADQRARYPSLADKRVFISGGGSGIGADIVEAFVAQGSRVAFVDIADEPSRALVERLSGDTAHAPRFEHCDITDVDAYVAAIRRAEAALGGIDVLINNAANDDRPPSVR